MDPVITLGYSAREWCCRWLLSDILNELWQTLSICYNRRYLRNLICHISSENVLTIDHW